MNILIKLAKTLLFGIILFNAYFTYAQYGYELVGEAIKNQSKDSIGTFDFPGISCSPLGVAYLSNKSYPDLFLSSDSRYTGFYYYKFEKISEDGIPVFSEAKEFKAPVPNGKPGCILQEKNNIYGFWYNKGKVISSVFDLKSFSFIVKNEVEVSFINQPSSMYVKRTESGNFGFVFSISDGKKTRAPGNWRSSSYVPYSPEGVYNGEVSYSDLYAVEIKKDFSSIIKDLSKISTGEVNVMRGHQNITEVHLESNLYGLVTGSRFGNLNFHKLSSDMTIEREGIIAGDDLITLRHPSINPTPISYPDSKGNFKNLIVSGEGGIYFYKYLSFSKKRKAPIYEKPKFLLKLNANLHGGSLVVPTMVDWDGDGLTDIVAGNSTGHILFFKNIGNDKTPKFISGQPLRAGGKEIHIQPGYGEDIQGPGESRWGYTCPNVVDWNQDGLYDIVMGDSRGKHTVYLNIGTKNEPKLAHEHPIYLQGLELHGTWRCRPGVSKIGNRMAYVTLDDDDEFHLYWQIDSYNLKDGFKLKLDDGQSIKGNFLEAGGVGRLKINVFDWDLDGIKDLIVGTPRHGCVPNIEKGLPWNYEKHQGPGAAILFLKNIGTDLEPIYNFPKLLKYKGLPIFMGQHSCAPTPWYDEKLKGAASLVIGRENGIFYYFDRNFISW